MKSPEAVTTQEMKLFEMFLSFLSLVCKRVRLLFFHLNFFKKYKNSNSLPIILHRIVLFLLRNMDCICIFISISTDCRIFFRMMQ